MSKLLTCILVLFVFPSQVMAGGKNKQNQSVRVEYDTTVSKKEFLVIPYSEKEKRETYGQLLFWDSDSIVVLVNESSDERKSIPSERLKGVYVKDGQKRAYMTGAAVGAGIGSFIYLVGALADPAYPEEKHWVKDEPLEAMAAIVGGSALTGAIFGWFARKDRWRKIERDESSSFILSISPAPNSFRLKLSFRF